MDPRSEELSRQPREEPFEESYLDITIHKLMLQDVVRTEAYERALKQIVKPGHSVLDFGCGTGVLSIFASRAGAKKVHAVDRTRFIRMAKKIAEKNEATNICFHHNDHQSLELDEKVDVLVSEWMGHFLFHEDMLGPLLHVRDKYLKPDGIMIPQEVSLHAGLVTDSEIFEDLNFFREKPYGIDFSPIEDVPFEQVTTDFFRLNQLMKPLIKLGSFNLSTLKAPPQKLVGQIIAEKSTTVYGICGWFGSTVADGIPLDTGPDDPYTHWSHLHFPLEKPFLVKKGKEITVEIRLPNDEEPLGDKWIWSLCDGTQTVVFDNMRYRENERFPLKPGML